MNDTNAGRPSRPTLVRHASAWRIVSGDQVIPLTLPDGSTADSWPTRRAAVAALAEAGMRVTPGGTVLLARD